MMKSFLFALQLLACFGLTARPMAPTTKGSCGQEQKQADSSVSCFQRGDDPLLRSSYPTCSLQLPGKRETKFPMGCLRACVLHLLVRWRRFHGSGKYSCSQPLGIISPLNTGGFTVFQDFDYTSGFKIGIGANLNVDDWVADVEYTYLRQTTHTSNNAPAIDTNVFGSTAFGAPIHALA